MYGHRVDAHVMIHTYRCLVHQSAGCEAKAFIDKTRRRSLSQYVADAPGPHSLQTATACC